MASGPLALRGDARLHQLSDAEASVPGGDGMALALHAGHGVASDVILGKPWSLRVRACDPAARWEGVILCLGPEGGPLAVRLSAGTREGVHAIRCELTTDFASPPRALVVTAPMDMIGRAGWRDIVVRYSGHNLELFIDGVVLDEEWPAGDVPPRATLWIGHDPSDTEAAGFRGTIARCETWGSALSDQDIVAFGGGAARVGLRAREILGEERPFSQYWSPSGHHTGVGDCMPFFHEGRFHLFYLFDRHGHASKYGRGAHQWAHVSTVDLAHWQHHPMAIPITAEWEGSICTGAVFHWDGVFRAFYATRTNDGSPAPLQVSTSMDGIHFTKQSTLGYLELPYRPGPARDPVVFHDEHTRLFHMLVTSELAESPIVNHGGCLAHLVSQDLEHWEQRGPFIVPGYTDQPECPDHFSWNGWNYLVFSNNGIARYRMSRDPLGPWIRPAQDAFDGPRLIVLKTAAFTGGRRIGVAFLGRGGYGGEVVFREIIQHQDGTLGTAFPVEMRPTTGDPIDLAWTATGRGALSPGDGAWRLAAPDGFIAVAASGIVGDVRITMVIDPGIHAGAFGICVRATGAYADGYELRIEPARGKVGWRRANANTIDECEREAIHGVTGLDRPFTMEIIVHGDCLDVCIAGGRTMIVGVPEWARGDSLALFAHHASVVFSDIVVRRISR